MINTFLMILYYRGACGKGTIPWKLIKHWRTKGGCLQLMWSQCRTCDSWRSLCFIRGQANRWWQWNRHVKEVLILVIRGTIHPNVLPFTRDYNWLDAKDDRECNIPLKFSLFTHHRSPLPVAAFVDKSVNIVTLANKKSRPKQEALTLCSLAS